MRRHLRHPDLLALAACLLLALLALYNPIFHLPDHVTTDIVPVVTDYFHYHWNEWWMRHALTSGLNVYETNYVFAPQTSSLALHPLTPLWYPLWALIDPLAGTAVAMTVVLVAGYTLTGFSLYLLLRDEGIAPRWALVGAAMLETMTLMTTSARWTLINLMAWFWLPVALLTWKRLAASTGARLWGWVLALGAAIWGMILTDLQMPLFVAPLIVPYALWTLWRTPRRIPILVLAGSVAIAIGLGLGAAVGPLDEAIRFDRTGLSPTPAERAVDIEFPVCYVTRCEAGVSVGSALLPMVIVGMMVWWRMSDTQKRVPTTADSAGPPNGASKTLLLPPAPPALWLLMIPIPLILSAGPDIQIGDAVISLPYKALHDLFGGMVRYPERFLPVFLIPAAVFALGVFNNRLRGPWARLVPTLLFLLVLADSRILEPMPVQPLPRPYAFYERIAAEPYDYVILEIPTGGASGEGIAGDARFAELQYYGTFHGKRMVNGHISRVPTYRYFYMNTDDPMLAWLGQRRFLEPETVEAQMRQRIADWPIGYFVIHRDLIAPDQSAINEIITFFNAHPDLVCWAATEGDLVAYRTTSHPDGCGSLSPNDMVCWKSPTALDSGCGINPGSGDNAASIVINLGGDSEIPFLGPGWYYPEAIFDTTIRWAGAAETAAVFATLAPGAYSLTVTGQAFHEPRAVTLLIDGSPVGAPVTIAPDALRDYAFAFELEGESSAAERVNIALAFDDRLTPREAGLGEDDRTLAIMVDRIILRLEGGDS
ncbi:MAG: hypothetical protein IPK19_15055 [Chloroflexi bacterium]|nr:hypothetical protein [Chloroflexota bacterium]